MKIIPSLEGGLRMDPEEDRDWLVLFAIISDARGTKIDLASRLGAMIEDETLAEDWQDLVVPDLRESFEEDLHQIKTALETASHANDQEVAIWITPKNAETWYSALNQARLNLEEIYQFHAEPKKPGRKPVAKQEAWFRAEFYLTLQSLILEHVF